MNIDQRIILIITAILLHACQQDNPGPPYSPQQEQASFVFADPDLTISLVAAEPDINSPVDMAWAPDGTLFVVETPGYPVTDNTGIIKRLTDTDGDGRYHLDAIYATDLNFPNSIMWYQGGLLVTDAPDVIFLKDTDNDGKADHREVILTGFDPENEQLRVNGLYWGLDNWIYGANGRSGGVIRYADELDSTSIDNRDFRFNPVSKDFEAISGMSQFGLAQDDWGNRFITINHRFARQVMLEERHLARNPSLAVEAVFDTYQSEHDRRVYTLTEAVRFNKDPIGYFTSLSGLTVNRGHLLGEDYIGDFFAGESVQSAVIHRRMANEGAIFSASDTHKGVEFLASEDDWFHPVNFSNGPDGAFYMVDFYRKFVEHPEWANDDRREGVDWKLGEGNGRIWRITHKDSPWDASRMNPEMLELSVEDLVNQLKDPAGWRRDMAQQLLVEDNKKQAAPYLVGLLKDDHPITRSHALWTLQGLGLLDEPQIIQALDDPIAQVKVQGIRLAEMHLDQSLALRTKVETLALDQDQMVRYYAILALGSTDMEATQEALINATVAYRDHWTRIALLSASAGWAGEFSRSLLANGEQLGTSDESDLEFYGKLGQLVAANEQGSENTWIVDISRQQTFPGLERLAFITGYLESKVSQGNSLPRLAPQIFEHAIALAQDDLQNRAVLGITLLKFSESDRVLGELNRVVATAPSNEIKIAAINTIARLDRTDMSDHLFQNLEQYDPEVRKALINSSIGSEASAKSLLQAIQNNSIAATEIPEELRYALMNHSLETMRDLAAEVLGSSVDPNRQAVVDKYLASLGNQMVDLSHGASLFTTHCSNCHAINGEGGLLAPDLTNIGSRPDEVLLVSILDPSRMVSYELRLHVIVTNAGDVYSGTISAETVSSLTIRQPDGQEHTILRENIKQNTMTGQSIMPEGFERLISEQDMASLIGYLRQPV